MKRLLRKVRQLKQSRLSETDRRRIFKIALEHAKLVAELGQKDTNEDRKAFIRKRIPELREERDAILNRN